MLLLDGTLECYQNLSVPNVHILNWILHIKRFLSLPSSFVLAVVRHITKVYETATIHSEDDYFKREGGEIPTEVYPNFPILREFTKEIWGSLQKRWQNARQEAKKRQLWKGFSCTCKANSWPIPVNMWLSTEVRIWVFNDDIWRKSIFVVWSGYDTVWSKLQPSSNLWCIMSCKRIRLQ